MSNNQPQTGQTVKLTPKASQIMNASTLARQQKCKRTLGYRIHHYDVSKPEMPPDVWHEWANDRYEELQATMKTHLLRLRSNFDGHSISYQFC